MPRAVRVAATLLACLAGALAPAATAGAAPSVAVSGNHLVDSSGHTMRLLGVNRSGAEYMCVGGPQVFDGPATGNSVKAMAAWHIDAVRVPLNEDCWLGINGVNGQASGPPYREAI